MYDFFISFKFSDTNGNQTEDYIIAKELYNELTNRGYNVFFSPVNISEKGKSQYMLAIDEALDESNHMIVIGTDINNIMSEYVQYEWLNFNTDILNGMKKTSLLLSLITENISVKELPRALRINEAFYYNKQDGISNMIAFLTDIVSLKSSNENDCTTSSRTANKYDVNDAIEKARLATQTRLSLEVDLPIISKVLTERKNVKLLDIGSNNGQWIRSRTEGFDNIDTIIGIDIDKNMIAEANMTSTDNQHFYSADCEDTNFYDRLCDIMKENNISHFDVVTVPLVLLHLLNPFNLLKTLYKVMGVNACIFIKEVDDSLILAHPDEENLIPRFFKISDYVPMTGYRHCGREVYDWLYTLEFRDIHLYDASINTINKTREERESILKSNFSYIKGDLEKLYEMKQDEKYKNDILWIEKNYNKLKKMFINKNFFYKNGDLIFTAIK